VKCRTVGERIKAKRRSENFPTPQEIRVLYHTQTQTIKIAIKLFAKKGTFEKRGPFSVTQSSAHQHINKSTRSSTHQHINSYTWSSTQSTPSTHQHILNTHFPPLHHTHTHNYQNVFRAAPNETIFCVGRN